MSPAVFPAVFSFSKRLAACALVLSALAPPVQALGIVSRSCAPFGAQESITVDWHFSPHYLWTASIHYRNGFLLHTVNSSGDGNGGWSYDWRSYAGHFGTEFWYGMVIGQHYEYRGGFVSFLGNSRAGDCNLSEWG
jgi:hypothetical protein